MMAFLSVTILLILGTAMMSTSLAEHRSAQRHLRLLSGFQLSEGGLDQAIRWMRQQPAPPAGVNPFDPFGGAQALTNGTYRVTIDPHDNNPTSYLDLYTISVNAQTNPPIQVTRQVSGMLRTQSFARFSYFTNTERLSNGTRVWFTSRDTLTGPVHSNDQFNIAGSPVFDGPVTSAASAINYMAPPPTGGNNPQFNEGLGLGVATVQMPASATPLRVAASSGEGQWYEGNTAIVFETDASSCAPVPPPCERVTNPVRGWTNRPSPLPSNGAIFVNQGNATVSGTLDGQVSVGTSHDLLLNGDLIYQDDPRTNRDSNDILGLVAERNVIIAQAAPYDLTIEASVMALNASFTVENWWVGPSRGALSVYGGIIQKNRGAVGRSAGARARSSRATPRITGTTRACPRWPRPSTRRRRTTPK